MGLHGVALAVVIVTDLHPPSRQNWQEWSGRVSGGHVSKAMKLGGLPLRRRNTTLCENFDLSYFPVLERLRGGDIQFPDEEGHKVGVYRCRV